jgi:hypothetical protein
MLRAGGASARKRQGRMQLTRKLRRQSALLLTRNGKRKSGSELMVSFLFNLLPLLARVAC